MEVHERYEDHQAPPPRLDIRRLGTSAPPASFWNLEESSRTSRTIQRIFLKNLQRGETKLLITLQQDKARPTRMALGCYDLDDHPTINIHNNNTNNKQQ